MRGLEFEEPNDEDSDEARLQREHEEQQQSLFRNVIAEHGKDELFAQSQTDHFIQGLATFIDYNLLRITKRLQLVPDQTDLLKRVSRRIQRRTAAVSSYGKLSSIKRPILITRYYTHDIDDEERDDPHADHIKAEWDVFGEFPRFIGFYGRNQNGEILKDVFITALPTIDPEPDLIRHHLNIAPSESIHMLPDKKQLYIGRNISTQDIIRDPYQIPESLFTTYRHIGQLTTDRLSVPQWQLYGCSETSYMRTTRTN